MIFQAIKGSISLTTIVAVYRKAFAATKLRSQSAIEATVSPLVLLFLGLLIVGLPTPRSLADEVNAARKMIQRPGVLVIAHRGASADFPENTLPAFEAAGEAKADLIELDYYHSRDGVPVVFHDETLDRSTNVQSLLSAKEVPVATLDLQTLKRLDAGSWFNSRFAGTTIPTLEEALAVIQSRSMTLIERKEGDAATCVRLLERRKLREQVVIQAFDWEYLKACHQLDSTLVLGALGSDNLSAERMDEAIAAGASVVGWNAKHLDADKIRLAKQKGLRVWSYTVNDTDRAKELIESGIDGLITDRPAIMRSIVDGKSR